MYCSLMLFAAVDKEVTLTSPFLGMGIRMEDNYHKPLENVAVTELTAVLSTESRYSPFRIRIACFIVAYVFVRNQTNFLPPQLILY